MDGIHDLGGMHGFGRVPLEPGEPVFHAPWEGRVFALASLLLAAGVGNLDAFRHAVERLDPITYLTAGYYGRWRHALETLLAEAGTPASAAPTARRALVRPPGFAPGDAVRARNLHPAGHTRLPRYVRGRRGTVIATRGTWVFPDAHAHGRGEDPQHVYTVRFEGRELWGDGGEPGLAVHVDCFEPYLEPARDPA